MTRCASCNKSEVKVLLVDRDETVRFCEKCYNEWMSDQLGLELKVEAEELVLQDEEGKWRKFGIHKHLSEEGLFLEAAEADEYGYQFAVHGELEEDQEILWKRLVDKVSEGISKRYIEEKALHGQKYSSMKKDEFVGRLAYSDGSGHHIVVIDGKPYSWDEVGKMLDAYEGFKIEVKVSDITD